MAFSEPLITVITRQDVEITTAEEVSEKTIFSPTKTFLVKAWYVSIEVNYLPIKPI